MRKVAIIGVGYVGKGMVNFFKDHYEVITKDREGDYTEVNKCDLAVVCVPTPMRKDGHCDTSIVEEVVKNLETPVIWIRSTIRPGLTEKLKRLTGKRIVFSPEYMGESKYWTPYKFHKDEKEIPYFVLGGCPADTGYVIDMIVPIVGAKKIFYQCSATEAELVKYMENTFFATKVEFANEWRDICEAFGCNYWSVREGWALDPRVEPMHTAVFKDERGFGGKCFPKDLSGIIEASKKKKYTPRLLWQVWLNNLSRRK